MKHLPVAFVRNAAQDTGVGATANSGAGSPIEGNPLPLHQLQLSARGRSPRVLFLSSEAYPLAKTGGLADVCGALPATLARLGVDVRVMIPGYPQALDTAIYKRAICDLSGILGEEDCRLIMGQMPSLGLPVLLFDCPRLFRRGGGLYQDGNGQDWQDNHRRFGVFCQAAAQVALGEVGLGWRPHIVHANDWHTGLVPALLRFQRAAVAADRFHYSQFGLSGEFSARRVSQSRIARRGSQI